MVIISNTVNINYDVGLTRNIVISEGGVLIITSEIVMANNNIHVESGGTFIIDGGRLLHADLSLDASSILIIRNNGLVHMKQGNNFIAPVGASISVESGTIY